MAAQSPTAYNRCARKASGLSKLDPGLNFKLKQMREGGVKCKVAGKVIGELAALRKEVITLKKSKKR